MTAKRHSKVTPQPIEGFSEHRGEELLFVVKRHPFTLLISGLIAVVALWVPYLVWLLGLRFEKVLGVSVIALVVAIATSYRAIFCWRLTNYVLTSDRVVAVVQSSLFSRSVAEAQLTSILAIRYDVPGIIRSIWNYGTVAIQASGVQEEGDVILQDVPNPYYYQEKIAAAQSSANKHP